MSGRRWDRRARQHWHELTAAEKRTAVWNMRDFGYGDHVIASATGLSVEAVREILAERKEAAE